MLALFGGVLIFAIFVITVLAVIDAVNGTNFFDD